jgi:glycolate oxidase subunit GlcD
MSRLFADLRAAVGPAAVLSERDELLVYECDGLPQHKRAPRCVVFPETTEQVAAVMKILQRARVPFVPRGAGTGLSGGAVALQQAVIIEFARMRRLLKLDVENRRAVVQTGLVNAKLSQLAAPRGLYYAPDPSSQPSCTIGGNVAENSGGVHCLKYGVTVDHVIAARVVLSDGAVTDFSAEHGGYDLLGLFIGSEGTFGLATEATLKLLPLPPATRTMLADFTDVDDASHAVSAIIAAGIIPAGLEMIDGATIRAVESSVFAAGIPTDAAGALLIELDGLEAGLDEEAARVEAICRANRARDVRRARDERERKKLWAARKSAFGTMGRLAPDLMLQDAVVPRSRLPEVLAATYRIGEKYRLRVANVFHAGDGNLHPLIPFDSRDPDETERVKLAGQEIMQTCVAAGGTITGEHGVGFDKSDYMPLIFSAADLDAMLRVRAAFDPSGLCNPGKIIPVLRGCGEARVVATEFNTETQRHRDTEKADSIQGNPNSAIRSPQFVHSPADLVATAPAGMSLREFNAALREAGQWLPLDPPDAGAATLGEIVARAAHGPLVLGYGAPRNMVLGMRVRLADGARIKCGGRVVKNVAGYDLCKLFTGSRGELGEIEEITFRLRPLPAADETVAVYGPREKLWQAGREIWLANLQPAALELLAPVAAQSLTGANGACVLLVRFTGAHEQVAWQTAQLNSRLASATNQTPLLTRGLPPVVWQDLAALSVASPLCWRARTLPGETLNLLDAALADLPDDAFWQLGCGDGRVRVCLREAWPADAAHRAKFDAWRARSLSLVIEDAPDEWRESYDLVGASETNGRLMRRLREALAGARPTVRG